MTHGEEETILRECLKREAAAAAAPEPPRWQSWTWIPWADEQDFGPTFSATDWFDARDDAARMRWTRALRRLEAAGLVQCHRGEYSRRIRHIRLTPTGKAAAEKLQAEATARAGRTIGPIPPFAPDDADAARAALVTTPNASEAGDV
jgi:hypothetical protein